MKKKIVFFTFMFFLLSFTQALAAVNISLLPSQSEIEAEETFTVSIEVSGVENLYGYEFGITFDPARFEVLTVREEGFFSRSAEDPAYLLTPILDNGSGNVGQIVGVRLTPGVGVTGTVMIAQLDIKEKSDEKSDYSSSISFSGQGKLLDSELKPLTVQESNACDIKVSIPNVDPDPDPDTDTDGDGLSDEIEASSCTDPSDADTDDDGLMDGQEDLNKNGQLDPGETDPCSIDSDEDGIQDGTELGLTEGDISEDTDLSIFQPDMDPSTTTNPLNIDCDGDSYSDGAEDLNCNGRKDSGESDPSDGASFPIAPSVEGDVNEDGYVDLTDAILCLQTICGIETAETVSATADVNSDGKIGIVEAIYVLRSVSTP